MERSILSQFASFGIGILISLLVVNRYGHKRYDPPKIYLTFWPRFWAGLVDSCVLWPLGFAAFLLQTQGIPPAVAALAIVLPELVRLLYIVFMHGRYGQTVGKMACKVRVIDNRTGEKITFSQAWLRESIPVVLSLGILVYELTFILSGKPNPLTDADGASKQPLLLLFISIPLLWFLAEIITMLANSKRRALHDLLAGTLVIRTNISNDAGQTA